MGVWDAVKSIGGALLPLAGPIGGIASTLIDASSQRATNAQNQQEQQRNRDFQQNQSSTAYQRATADMTAAGLNPALAYQQGGASTASGGAATATAPFQNTPSKFSTALDTYNNLASGVAQRDLLREQTNAANANAHLTRTQANAQLPDAQLGTSGQYQREYAESRFAGLRASRFTSERTPQRFSAELKNINSLTNSADATAQNLRAQTTLSEQQFMNEWFRKNVNPYLQSTAATIKPFTPAIRFRP